MACFLAAQIVAVVPSFVAAGLLMFIGAAMLEDRPIATRRRMILRDWLIGLGILILTISVGILPAVGVGLGLAMLTFVIGFIRQPIIRRSSSACAAMQKLGNKLQNAMVGVPLVGMPKKLETMFRRWGWIWTAACSSAGPALTRRWRPVRRGFWTRSPTDPCHPIQRRC